MNREISRLLREAGVTLKVGWRDFVVVQNWPHRSGFNFVILASGTPKIFGKCRHKGDAALEHETMVRSCLARCQPEGLSVPTVRSSASERIALQVGPFIHGSRFGFVVPSMSMTDYLATLRTVLSGVGELADFAQNACAGLSVEGPTVDLRASARESLAFVEAHVPLDVELLEALTATLSEAGTTPSRPQHGDLWSPNVLIADGRPWAIDLEHYGELQIALYDDLTLLSSTLEIRPGHSSSGIEWLTGPGSEPAACREILSQRAASERVAVSQLDGVLAYYVTHRAFNVYRRSGIQNARQHLDAVRYVAERFARGERGLLQTK